MEQSRIEQVHIGKLLTKIFPKRADVWVIRVLRLELDMLALAAVGG
jgi:hypothetical protein